ncbi:glycosyltransferase [Gemmobacter lutimaris]|nr:glycosyltransferase [Gemmobacter lutimaris]
MTRTQADADRITASAFFDAEWYIGQHPDLRRPGALGPAAHYLRIGWRLGRDPGPEFSTRAYLEAYGDHIPPDVNPLLHFLDEGEAAGLSPLRRTDRHALILQLAAEDMTPGRIAALARHAALYPPRTDRFLLCPAETPAPTLAAFPGVQRIDLPPGAGDAALTGLEALAEAVDLAAYGLFCRIGPPLTAPDGTPVPDAAATLADALPDAETIAATIADFRADRGLKLGGSVAPLPATRAAARAACLDLLRAGCFWFRPGLIARLARTEDIADPAERLLAAAGNGIGVRFRQAGQIRRSRIEQDRPQGQAPDGLRGNLDLPTGATLRGWLALQGDTAPRRARLSIGSCEIEVTAGSFRDDLLRNGINAGWHGFQVQVPMSERDGQPRDVVLRDAETGRVVARRQASWRKPKPEYADFQGFLRHRMTQPLIEGPFAEEDKRCFAVMEGIANRFCARAAALEAPPLVSVVMPVFNREAILAEAIASVLAQDYPHFELIVVDDGSSDGSVAVAEGFADPRLRLIRLPENRGQTVARNTGLAAAQGTLLAFLDSDNQWDSRYLGAMVGAFDSLPAADAIYSGMLLYRGTEPDPFAVRYGHFNRALLENKNYIDTNVIALRRRALGPGAAFFDETLRRYPDYDAILRFSETGRLVSVPVLLCHYFYDKAENAMTSDPRHAGDMAVIRARLAERQAAQRAAADRAGLERPVTVVIPNWQSPEDLRDCLAALAARDWQGLLEIVVADNGSDEAVLEPLRAGAAAGRLRLIESGRNYGFTHAANLGIAAARPGSDILLLNNDAIVQGGAIQALQRAALTLPSAGMTVPRQILPGKTKTIADHVPFANPGLDCDVNISAHHRNLADVPVFHDGGALELGFAPFFAVYIRHEVLAELGPLDAEYGRHYRSDRVFCDMMRSLTGLKLYYVPEAHVIHKLQQATDRLRGKDGRNAEFELMFRRNQWDAETAAELGFRAAPWDTF